MIRFSCSNCGAAFKVKDEHAGKRVKCPKCATSNAVPEPVDEAVEVEPAVEAPVSRKKRRAGAGRRSTSARVSRGRKTEATPKWMAPVLLLAVVIGGVVVAMKSMEGPDYGKVYSRAGDALTEGRNADALAALEAIPLDDSSISATLAGRVRERIQEAEKRLAAEKTVVTLQRGTTLYEWLKSVERTYLDDHTDPNYAATTRFVLKRAREFERLYSDHEKLDEVKKLHSYYRNVASLSNPPTADDVRAEMRFRRFANKFHLSFDAIDEFVREANPPPEVVDELRGEVRAQALEDWSDPKEGDRKQARDLIAEGRYTQANSNLGKLVEGYAPFAEVSREIEELRAEAQRKKNEKSGG